MTYTVYVNTEFQADLPDDADQAKKQVRNLILAHVQDSDIQLSPLYETGP